MTDNSEKEVALQHFVRHLSRSVEPNEIDATISVVMPSFNHAHFIERSILSVLNQDYPNIELIIIDGGSTDETVDIIKKYSKYISHWVSEKDEGQSDALNKGFALATGEIVAWLNSDDLYLPGAFQAAAAAFKDKPKLSVVFGDWWSIDVKDRLIEINPAFDFSLRHFVYEGFTHNSQAMFWTREAHERFKSFDTSLYWTMDYDLILRLGAREGEDSFLRIPGALACFRRHPDQKTLGLHDGVLAEHRGIAERTGFTDKFTPLGKCKRIAYRLRRLVWYTKRRGLHYTLLKAAESLKYRWSH